MTSVTASGKSQWMNSSDLQDAAKAKWTPASSSAQIDLLILGTGTVKLSINPMPSSHVHNHSTMSFHHQIDLHTSPEVMPMEHYKDREKQQTDLCSQRLVGFHRLLRALLIGG